MFDTLHIKVTGAELISVPTAAGILTDKPCQLLVYLNTLLLGRKYMITLRFKMKFQQFWIKSNYIVIYKNRVNVLYF